ncbi:GxxExxY protein [Limihaloglobus sulfuriphilus]|uniref:GxxExxY protein n=1 Tax=Limihaloglobus sulfuriphilus TaxID=1851148 RepID=A0A1R7T5Y8_9BACT|nr:GxxExxY protein [Limihaloglobus sulfuriphilus]AQQ72006.1 GxxExxY protein [Limihaloglobus sulfuriphilus]
MNIDKLTEKIIGCAFLVHKTLGSGFLEKVYENAMRVELQRSGCSVTQQAPLSVYYGNQIVGEYLADLIVNDLVIVEIKAIRALAKEHEVQLVNYLNATCINDGLLINFGNSVQVKRKFKNYIK